MSAELAPAASKGGHLMDSDTLRKSLLEKSDPDGPCIEKEG